jgi:cell division control protein 45
MNREANISGDYKDTDFFEISKTLETETQDVGTITISKELKMTLLRHWTLYDSIANSNYCVSHLKIGKEPGLKTFKRFLATIGCPLE